MKKVLGLVLTVVLMTGLFAACGQKSEAPVTDAPVAEAEGDTGGETAANADETYVFMCPLANLEYWQAYRVGLEDACAELGVTAKFLGDDGLEADAMCAILETAINDPTTAGIIMPGHFPEAYEPYYEMAWEKGIPVVNVGQDVPNSRRLSCLGSDYVTYGAMMLDQAAEAINESGEVIISQALSAGSSAAEEIMTGIHNQIEKYPNMKIVAEVDDQSDAAVAATKIGAALLANPDTAVIIGCQAPSAVGAVTAVKEAGMSGKVKIISIDRDSATLEYVKNGDIYSTVAGKQYTEVYYGTKICYDFNHGPKSAFSNDDMVANLLVAPNFVDTGSLVINQENVDYFLDFNYADK